MTSSAAPAGIRAFTYNSLNERITDAGVSQQFDANGNLSAGMGFSLSWDAEDRVKAISFNGTQNRVEYDYDGLGRRTHIRLMQSGVTSMNTYTFGIDSKLSKSATAPCLRFPWPCTSRREKESSSLAPISTTSTYGIDSPQCVGPLATRLDHPTGRLSAVRTVLSSAACDD